jgi:hypothetical protein
MARKHTMPQFLVDIVTAEKYESWLGRKATAHVKRDRKRQRTASVSHYKEAIHAAVVLSDGRDAYTGELLDWARIGTYDNDESQAGRHGYKAQHALLPTVDHVDAGATEASFKICAWRTNDAKNDLTAGAVSVAVTGACPEPRCSCRPKGSRYSRVPPPVALRPAAEGVARRNSRLPGGGGCRASRSRGR